MLKVIKHFEKYCSRYLQVEYVGLDFFLKPAVSLVVGGECYNDGFDCRTGRAKYMVTR